MALRKCADCGREVSTAARTCPACGKPQSPGLFGIIIAVIGGLLITLFLFGR
jgi:RNA polymerase subunit RPABC4/transcription elongation factor Spt4